ncbi:MAG: hypothetical protein M1818_003091 [Claussenomyces sp. TS43310]|nr:MAG: hypothetical protein M1818_003091 [Claussenomyces sp. TS43310]
MFDFRNFDEVFAFEPEYTYDQSEVEKIDEHRTALEGLLFVDLVLKLLELKRPSKHYPPRTNSELRNLHQAVITSNAADHTKLSLLYYLLLDSDVKTRRHEHSERFQEISSLPGPHQILMRGLWHMDKLEFEVALQYLTHPSLIPTFHEEILTAFVRHAKHDDFTLALSYYYTVQPTITTPEALGSLFSAIMRTSVGEAFFFQRGQSDSTRKQLFEMLVSFVMQTPAGEKAAARAAELVNLPFASEEELWFEEYLTTGTGRQYKRAKDTLIMRKIGTGRYSAALSMEGMDSRQIDGLSWEIIQAGLENGLGPRFDIEGAH